ncbi:hypothetical protein ABZS81_13450 [Streptomyces sp. NPDC005318]|uniref:hypothetical protein n=1 Tax=Streptomyces sp. NPDC005318 TaxID=3157031 RepID=UPI0033A8B7DB
MQQGVEIPHDTGRCGGDKGAAERAGPLHDAAGAQPQPVVDGALGEGEGAVDAAGDEVAAGGIEGEWCPPLAVETLRNSPEATERFVRKVAADGVVTLDNSNNLTDLERQISSVGSPAWRGHGRLEAGVSCRFGGRCGRGTRGGRQREGEQGERRGAGGRSN